MKKYLRQNGNSDPKTGRLFKKGISLLLILAMSCGLVLAVGAREGNTAPVDVEMTLDCKSAILMEASTGTVLFEQNADEALPPASVTKIMTLLLIMEAIEQGQLRYEDTVTASAHACSMGGSQIYLKEGEQMTVEDMVKSVVIASANDAAVALAEHVAGSEAAFVERMNERAAELGMVNTHFENTNGLDDTVENHVTSARDIALMSQALIRYPKITEYSSIWMDTVRNGEFGLTNTNRLVRFYKGATGLKTGSTSKAGFCVSATAEREGMTLICVIMAAPSRDIRNAAATALLDFGFANFAVYRREGETLKNVEVLGGVTDVCEGVYDPFSTVVKKSDVGRVERKMELTQPLTAPIAKGERIGCVIDTLDGKEIGRSDIVAVSGVEKIGFWGMTLRILRAMSIF